MADVGERDQATRLDRSNCILPPSSVDLTATGRDTVSVDVDLVDQQSPEFALSDASFPSILKACWILTLQCFIVADVICFKYSGSLDPEKDGAGDEDNTVQYYTRVDPTESIWSFLQRLDRCRLDPDVVVEGHDIGVAHQRSSYHHCNTGIYIRKAENDSGFVNFEADVQLLAGSSHTSIQLVYNRSHTSTEMATSILRTFQQIYSQVGISSQHTLLREIDPCPHDDRDKIQGWTGMDPVPVDSCLHDLILEQCRLRPDEMAICSWDGNLTYRELDDLSLRLANLLMELGVGPEVFVLSCFEKSTWAIVARLAILRAGGAYISVFASDPPVYLESVIARTKTHILLTDPCHVERFQGIVPTLIELSPTWLRGLPAGSRDCQTVQPDSACLVLFTSGSTGTPKGIIQSHKGYASAIKNYARDLQLDSRTRFFQFDDYAFDISNLEFLVPLVLGGCCCVPGPMKTIHDLTGEINSMAADTIFLTPTVAIKLEPRDIPHLKTLCVGGEPLPKELVAKWKNTTTKLVNQYGMGEVAICCALNTKLDPVGGAKVGRPSTGTIWLVDPSTPNKLMPIGAVGEIMVEGPHLSRGYLDDTATRRTEAGFLKATPPWLIKMHPNRTHTRIYRSGDLGRLNHDGTITYLGRKDTILKLDGCRIDALEVEHQAKKCLSKDDNIIVDLLGIINGQDEPSLAALIYLDGHPDSTPPTPNAVPLLKDATTDAFACKKIREIRDSIAQSLPHYMMPTRFVLMSWLPRTASKKVDRKKIHMLGQLFYFAQLEHRRKDVSYAQKI
ncbi:putative lysergyl peptide synthetase [Rosellinia necatrix]|uniref:Putative lysergyl peptide synthetase n=1 Tax=Rosellinia necatrix TaxID=77044 RepID=A0A1W2TBH2_ROSNE|nr:putative lysergyl peptide synthetase [Rosellinia necatrix]